MHTNAELLRRYVEARDEDAFAELVRCHIGLVYAAALRRTGGRAHLADDVTQAVFCDLARKAPSLVNHPVLNAWLHRSTRYAAIDATRAERRRRTLEQSMKNMLDDSTAPEPGVDWGKLRPVLDGAMDQLRERDREVLLLRFFNGLTFAEVGTRLDLSENAARVRAGRALEKLRAALGRLGVTSTSTALAMALTNQAIAAVPGGLAEAVTGAALAGAPAGFAATGLVSVVIMNKLTIAACSIIVAAGLTTAAWKVFDWDRKSTLASLRGENDRLRAASAVRDSQVAAVASSAADEIGARLATLSRALDKAAPPHPTASSASSRSTTEAETTANGHRFLGQGTPHDALMSFTWASEVGDTAALAKLIAFDGNGREKAAAFLASLPETVRAQYPTPEALYALFIAADALLAPPPGADVIEPLAPVEVQPGRVEMRQPGAASGRLEFQQTETGWKYVFPEHAVEGFARQVLGSELLTRLDAH